jgi:hypothetical protein
MNAICTIIHQNLNKIKTWDKPGNYLLPPPQSFGHVATDSGYCNVKSQEKNAITF